MEAHERETISRLSTRNLKLKRLLDRHRDLEQRLLDLESRKYRTSSEDVQLLKLKKEKLVGKDQIMKILADS